jgi:hypothetical protein
VKVPSPLLAVESIRKIRIVVGMTIGMQFGSGTAIWVLVDFPLAVIPDEQVKLVVVVVDPGGRHGPHLFAVKIADLSRSESGGQEPVAKTCKLLVEAAGVEPASENVTGQEPTCVVLFMPQALPWDVRGARSERTRNAIR